MSSYSKNIFSLSVGQFISLILNFFSIVLAARFLGVEEFGTFTSSLALILIISKFVDFGLAPIVFREQSKLGSSYNHLNSAISIRLIISIIILILANAAFILFDYTINEIIISNALFFNIYISQRMANIRELLATPFKVILKMHYPMTMSIFENLMLLVMIMFMPIFNLGINYFVFSYVFASLPSFFLMLYYLKKKTNYIFNFNLTDWQWLIKQSLPLAGFVILLVIFQQIDIILLKYYKGLYDTGIFSASTRLTMPLNIIPTTLVTTFFPSLVRNIQNDEKNKPLILIIFKFLFWISFLMALYVSGNATNLVVTLFGSEYSESATSTIFLFWAQVFLFFNFFALDLLTAYNKQNWNFVYAIILVLSNIIFAVLLVPYYGYNGASTAKLLASIVGVLLLIFILIKFKIPFQFINFRVILSFLLLTVIVFFMGQLNIVIYSALFLFLAFIITYYFKFFSNSEIEILIKYVPKLKVLEKYLIRN